MPQVGQWLVQFRDWRLCWCAKGRSLVEQKLQQEVTGEEARKLLDYKAGRKRWAKLEFLGKGVCGCNADKGGRFHSGYLSERSKIQAKEGNAVIFGQQQRVNRKSMLFPQFQPEVAITSSSYCRSIQGRAKECVVACDCLYVSVSVFKAACTCLYMF